MDLLSLLGIENLDIVKLLLLIAVLASVIEFFEGKVESLFYGIFVGMGLLGIILDNPTESSFLVISFDTGEDNFIISMCKTVSIFCVVSMLIFIAIIGLAIDIIMMFFSPPTILDFFLSGFGLYEAGKEVWLFMSGWYWSQINGFGALIGLLPVGVFMVTTK